MATLAFDDLERVYEQMAVAIDQAGPVQESLFLTKLALALAEACGDLKTVETCIRMALRDLDREIPSA